MSEGSNGGSGSEGDGAGGAGGVVIDFIAIVVVGVMYAWHRNDLPRYIWLEVAKRCTDQPPEGAVQVVVVSPFCIRIVRPLDAMVFMSWFLGSALGWFMPTMFMFRLRRLLPETALYTMTIEHQLGVSAA